MRRILGRSLLGVIAILMMPGCNNGFGAFQIGVGNTPNRPPLAAFRILGQFGMQFSAVVSAADQSWNVTGAVPMNIIVINNQSVAGCTCSPIRVIATKQSGGNGILSLQLTLGFTVRDIASTSEPYGVVTLQNNPNTPGFTPPPPLTSQDDVRLFIRGPITERFSGLFEDSTTAFILDDRAPALFLFDHPNGHVDASVTQIQNHLGQLDIDLLLNGALIAHAIGGPTVIIRQP